MTLIDDHAMTAHAISKANGFWDEEVDVHFLLSKLALLHSEVSEILEAVRKEQGSEKIVEEMADTYIRLIDLFEGAKRAGWLDSDACLGKSIEKKMAHNASRPPKHGNLA